MRQPMRDARAVLVAGLATVLLFSSGCMSYLSVRGHSPPRPSSAVQVWLSSPRSLESVSPSGDTATLGGVMELTGAVTAVSGDTLEVEVQSVNRRPPPNGAVRVRIAPVGDDRVETRQFNPTKTLTIFAAVLAFVFVPLWMMAPRGT